MTDLDRKFKRNDVVDFKGNFPAVFGRVVKRIDENSVLVIDCNYNVKIYLDRHLMYYPMRTGYWVVTAGSRGFKKMPRLRRLKQKTKDPFIWKKKSRKRRIEEFIKILGS